MINRAFATSGVGAIDAIAKSLSILVIEDDPGDYGLIKAYLRQAGLGRGGPPLIWARTLAEGIAAAGQKRPDVLLLDLTLPDSLGMSTVAAMNTALPGVPIVVLTGHDDSRLAVAVLESGAQDYLVKGQFDHHALGRAVRHALIRGRLESRLRLFEVAVNSAANGIVITDIGGVMQWVNPAFTQMTGFSAEEALGRNSSELIKSGKQDPAFYRAMWETILSGKVWRGEIVNRHKDGTFYDVALAISPVTGDGGAIQSFVAIMRDITERKQAELQIRQSEQRLELALAGSDLGLWDWHIPSGEMVFNARWCAMLGYAMDEIAANVQSWEQLAHPEDWPLISVALESHLKGDTPAYETEHRLRHKEGHWVWVLDRGKVVVRDEQGNPQRAAGTHLDISNHKRLTLEGAHLLRRIESLIRDVSQRPIGKSGEETDRPAESGKFGRLSTRQRQVLELVAAGCTSADIAEKLHITPATVVTHRRDLMRKLDLHSVAELTRYAIENNRASR